MQKIQILFPDPMMARLRQAAAAEDRPVSEIVRRAVDRMFDQQGPIPSDPQRFPTTRAGRIHVSAADLKSEIYRDDE